MIFVDTGGWFAYLIPTDLDHATAAAWMIANRTPLLTTDYVIDETLTLLRSRGQNRIAVDFGTLVFAGQMATIHYLTSAEIAAAWNVFHRYADKYWSFTDCTCKVIMESFAITSAFSFDQHFRQFGTVSVVP